MATSETNQKWVEFVARYHGDAGFARQVDGDPAAELRKAGIPVPEGKTINLVKDSETTKHLVLPSSPVTSVEELGSVYAGSYTQYCAGGCDYTGNE